MKEKKLNAESDSTQVQVLTKRLAKLITNKKNTKLKLTLVMDGESETVDSRRATDVSLNRSEEKREKRKQSFVLFCFL